MSPSPSPIPPSSSVGETLSRTLRLAAADEENRALLGSYAISTSLGVAFLLLLQFGPRSEQVNIEISDRFPSLEVRFENPPEPTEYPRAVARSTTERKGVSTSEIGRAFGVGGGTTTAGTTDVAGLLNGVAVDDRRSSRADAQSAEKTVLAYGEAGAGSTVPGRRAGGGGGAGIGGVGKGAGVGRSALSVTAPAAVPVAPIERDGRDGGAVGTYMRGHEAELRFCYQDRGLALDPNLGGTITVAVTVAASGAVRDASIARRSWSGAAAEAAEACILRSIRSWRLPASDGGVGTYALPFSFTR